MRSLLTLLLIPVLVYGAAMGYLWYEVKSKADDAVKAAASFAQISYGSIHVSLLGDEIGLNNIVIKPVMTQDVFQLEKVRLTGPYPGYFVITGHNLNKGEPPESLSIQLSRLHLDINSEIFTMLENASQQMAPKGKENSLDTLVFSLDALGCSDTGTFTQKDYRSMGFGQTVADIRFDLAYDEIHQHMQAKAKVKFDGIYTITTTFGFNVDPKGKVSQALNNKGIPKFSIDYQDTGYYKYRNGYCAKRNNNTTASYIDRHIHLVGNKFGITFPEETIAAYAEFMQKGGNVTLDFNPSGTIPFSDLNYYKPADIIQILGMDVTVNATRLNLSQITTSSTPGKYITRNTQQSEGSPVVPRTPPRPTRADLLKKAETATQAPSFKTVSVSRANKYIGSMVEVTTVEGRVRKGFLEKVTPERIHLVFKRSGGTLSFPIDTTYITRFKVLQ